MLALVAGALTLAGCVPKAAVSPHVPVPASGDRRVLLTLTPAAPRALDPTVFTVHVTGKDNRPVINAQVTADLSMPGMAMPPNTVSFTPSAPGAYTGQGRFSMPDQWAVSVTVVDRGRRTVTMFPVSVR